MPNIVNEIKLDFKDVLLRPKRSTLKSRSDVNLNRNITFRNSKRTYQGVPVMASNMDTVGTFRMAKALSKHGLFTTLHKYYNAEEWKAFAAENPDCLRNVAASAGMSEVDFERLSDVLAAVPDITFICLDVANGYSQHFVDFVRKVRAKFPTHTIIAGNVVTGEMVEELILSGADIIKVGIGPGSVCTTRMKTGVGYPQLSAVLECADAAHGLQGHIISDGGCTCAGDVAKAFGAGADFVMAGGMFAGHDQCEGEVIEKDGKKYKLFYGMSSSTAMEKHAGLISDSFHMFFDCTGLLAGLAASVITKWKANDKYSYGYVRAEVLAGFVNGLFLLFIAFFIMSEAVERAIEPPEVKHERLFVVSVLGLLVNLVGIYAFQHGHSHGGSSHGHSHGGGDHHGHSHNSHGHSHDDDLSGSNSQIMKGVFLHILADTLGSVGVIISAVLMQMFGWMIADPICSIFIALLIIVSVLSLIKDSVLILMQRQPNGLDNVLPQCYQKVVGLPGVYSVQEPHFWTLCSDVYVGALKLEVSKNVDPKYVVSHTHMIFAAAGVRQLYVQLDYTPM